MIEITNLTETAPRSLEKAKRDKPYVTRLNDQQYKVVPRSYPKQKRVVTFRQVGERRFAECRDFYTNELCPAAEHERCCYHVGAAVRRRQSNEARRTVQPITLPTVHRQVTRPLPEWYAAPKIRGIRI